jgi:hypothetical protein
MHAKNLNFNYQARAHKVGDIAGDLHHALLLDVCQKPANLLFKRVNNLVASKN